jgi:hypothetical protein
MASRLKEAVRYQSDVSAYRKKKSFLDILTPSQAILYQEWLLSNRDRCSQVLDERRKASSVAAASTVGSLATSNGDGNLMLETLCRNLEEILKISKVSDSSPTHM